MRGGGPAATTLDARVRDLDDQLRRVERERDILKNTLAIFSQHERCSTPPSSGCVASACLDLACELLGVSRAAYYAHGRVAATPDSRAACAASHD